MRKILLECLLAVTLSVLGTVPGLYLRQFTDEPVPQAIIFGLCQGLALIVFFRLQRRLFGAAASADIKRD